ncbi:ABC transporter ATP-binding protein [Oceanotoga teriensis]|uniref:ATP-binding cassette subfamily B protein n=1 Tax=Oceanotoga teriensis TaxID=515440 RepID=A0AA45HK07_9BACT|nr:ABC transporter ATP-binding protein [Oceanotoga teriensis]MDO7975300.1 ABC transporter ATP-binding protein/permease [Oceanotoga teriensis]PWJ96632.1 ATP-binding cassette subfamily B protein [Oceanotoga teriensis]
MYNYLKNKFALSNIGTKSLIKGIFLSSLINLCMMLPVGIFIMMINELLNPLIQSNSQFPSILKYLTLIIITLIIMFIVNYFQYSSVYISTYNESENRRIKLAEKLRELPLSFFGKRNVSDLTSILLADCASLEHAFSHAIPQLFGSIISTIIIIIALITMNWKMGLAVLWVLPVSFGIIIISKKIQTRTKALHKKAKLDATEQIQECFENIQDIKAYNITKNYMNDLDRKLDISEKAQIKSEFIMATFVTSSQAILRLGLVTVVLIGSNLLINGQTDFITYLIFLITASRLYDPLSGNLENIAEIFSIELPINRMKEIENYKIQNGKKEYELKNFDIKFENISFSYKKDEPVLKNINFTAKQGEVTALIGPSGCGKSTIAKLAARFWDPDDGKIFLGENDINKIDPESLLKNYTIVFQDVTLFNDSILENIRIGNRNASDQEVKKAAKLAMCDDFINKLPDKYNTIIGENGSSLSGGERQRISIARAFLKNSPIVLLDEATASLDVENETQIQKAISKLIQNKTVIVVAHRMRTIENADKIIVLDDGHIIQEGNSKELLNKNGLFKHMLELQNQSMEWSL